MRYLLAIIAPPLAILFCGRLFALVLNAGGFILLFQQWNIYAAWLFASIHALWIVERHLTKRRFVKAIDGTSIKSKKRKQRSSPKAASMDWLSQVSKTISKKKLEDLYKQIPGRQNKKAIRAILHAWNAVNSSNSYKNIAKNWTKANETLESAMLDDNFDANSYEQLLNFLSEWCHSQANQLILAETQRSANLLRGRPLGAMEAFEFAPFNVLSNFLCELPSFNDGGSWSKEKQFQLRVWLNQLKGMSLRTAQSDAWAQRALQ